ncbi:MAG: lysozyme inhibitor LprI family protein [Erythrobacter sp.]|jgi:uncharacterized protein YecT (DUF1311 family)|nr:lysozyme inhibitor LprI family protein [Erythrobacter sp.]
MIAAILLLAQAASLSPCDQEAADRGVQSDMNICAHREYLEADAELNAQWRETREHMRRSDTNAQDHIDPARDDRPGYFETLLTAQRAWIAYRDAHCRSEGYYARGGSLEPLLVSTCKTQLTRERTQQLRELTEGF